MQDRIEDAIHAAARYLLARQEGGGHWEEYALPVGRSDAWVTAYIGLALREVAPAAAVRAAGWLEANRSYAAGWGYNGTTGPDADSTAHALALMRAAGLPARPRDEEWLLERWQPGGGFATFERPGAWACAHVDITPVCFRALSAASQTRLRAAFVGYLRRTRRGDGSWPSYWWRTCFYATHACLQALRDFAPGFEPLADLARFREINSIASAFDLAFATGIAALQGREDLTQALTRDLLRRQNSDGSWTGGEDLRVTDPGCHRPWEQPHGRLYKDIRGLIATATSISILGGLRK